MVGAGPLIDRILVPLWKDSVVGPDLGERAPAVTP